MNKTYRSVWSHANQAWVAAPETAKARGKSARCAVLLATGAAGLAASLAPLVSSAATPGTVGKGSLQLCSGASGNAWGNTGGNEALDCSTDGKGTTDGLTFSLNNAGDGKGGYGFGASTARVSGYQNGTLALKGASIMAYGPTTFDSVVTMSNQKIVQLAPGVLAANSTEAVNGSQLYATNQSITSINGKIRDAVTYDSSAHDSVTLGSAAAMQPVALHNVAPGALTKSSADAVNGAQLYATNQRIKDVVDTGTKYFHANSTLGDSLAEGTDAIAIGPSSVASGTNAVAQGKAATAASLNAIAVGTNSRAGISPSLNNSAIAVGAASTAYGYGDLAVGVGATAGYANTASTYAMGSNAIGYGAAATHGGGVALGAFATAGGRLSVGVGFNSQAEGDLAMALGALTEAKNGGDVALGYGSTTSAAVSTAGATIAGKAYNFAGAHPGSTVSVGVLNGERTITNVAAGSLSSTSTDAVNGSQLFATNARLADLNNASADAVLYDSSAHDSVTLGSAAAMQPVALHNVADGTVASASKDAVNGGQLYDAMQTIAGSRTHYVGVNAVAGYGNYDGEGAIGEAAIAVGPSASAAGYHSVAIGAAANAAESTAIALGDSAQAAEASVALGLHSAATTWNDIAIGTDTAASGGSSLAMGVGASASGYHATAIGAKAKSLDYYTVALGDGAQATNERAIAVGAGASAQGRYAIALGNGANAGNDSDVALGSGSLTKTAVGTPDMSINGVDRTFAGGTPVGTVSIGDVGTERTLTNVAAGRVTATSTDAINGSQLSAVVDSLGSVSGDVTKIHNTILTSGWGAQASSADPTAYKMGGFIMDTNGNVSNPSVLYVPNTVGTANAHIVLDPGQGDSPYFVISGDRDSARLPQGTVISNVADGILDTDAASVGQVQDLIAKKGGGGGGDGIRVSVQTLLKSPGLKNAAAGTSGVDLTNANGAAYKTAAYYSQVRGASNAVGSTGPSDAARANGAGSVAIGSNTEANGGGGTALGIQSLANANDSVALGSGSVANQDNTVSVGSDGASKRLVVNPDGSVTTIQSQLNTRRIVNMAAGQDDTDAANVGQLRSVASALGGGAGINAAGAFIAPSYSVGGTTVNTVGDAIANLDNRVTQNTTDIAALNGGSAASGGMAAQASSPRVLAAARPLLGASDTPDTTDANALHYDSAAHDAVTLASNTGGNVTLSGLQDGSLDATSTDAVTGKQLYATNQQVATINQMVQNIATTGSTAVAVNSDSGAAAASGASAFAAGGGAVATGASSTAIGDKANASATNSVAIGANSVANRDNAVSVGAEGAERQIVNVKAGTSGTDAVNLDQMNNAMKQQSAAINQQVSSLQSSINTVSKNAYAGVAAAMAMPNLTPSGPGRTVVAAGGGYYMGGSAAAVGATYRSSDMHWLMNGAVSVTSTGNAGVRAQVGYEF